MKQDQYVQKAAPQYFARGFVYLSLFIVTFLLFYKQNTEPGFVADNLSHLNFAERLFTPENHISYPIFHLTALMLRSFFNIPLVLAGAIASSLYIMLCLFLLEFIIARLLPDLKSSTVLLLSLTLNFLSPIYIPWFNQLYLGQGGPSVWHNPPCIVEKPFALAVFFMFVWLLERDPKSFGRIRLFGIRLPTAPFWYAAFSAILMLDNLAKPSFSIIFLPAAALMLLADLVRSRGKSFFRCLWLGLSFIPILAYLPYQYFMRIGKPESISGIEIDLFKVWSTYSPNVFISVLLGLAFPIFVLLMNIKRLHRDRTLLLSWIIGIIAMAELSLFALKGADWVYGDFFWGYYIAQLILQTVSLIRFVEYYNDPLRKRLRSVIACAAGVFLYLCHLSSGIYYFIAIYKNGSFSI